MSSDPLNDEKSYEMPTNIKKLLKMLIENGLEHGERIFKHYMTSNKNDEKMPLFEIKKLVIEAMIRNINQVYSCWITTGETIELDSKEVAETCWGKIISKLGYESNMFE